MSTAGYLQDAKNQQKRLAETITAKGITATATEKYKDLVDKVAQIENLKGEERTLENFTNVLSEPKSVVQLKYPNNTPKTLNAKLGSKNLIPYPYFDATKTLNGITFTVNSDGSVTVSGTATAQAYFKLQQSFSLKKGQYFFSGCPKGGTGATYSLYLSTSDYVFYKADIGNGISINSEDDKTVSIVINIAKDTTVENLVFKPQLELGSVATAYTPYISDLSTVTVTRCGKNLLSVMSLYPTITNNAVLIHFKSGQTYTLSMTSTYEQYRIMLFGTDINGTAFDATSQDVDKYIQGMYTGNTGRLQSRNNKTAKTLSLKCNTDCIITAIVFWNVANESEKIYSDVQLELGSTATTYESYQGQSYAPTAIGEVTGIANLYPTTTLLTNNAGVVFEQITGGFYKEILPSTDKNGITKVYQPSVDNTIDSNITSDNIKQGVSILGVTGDYICNYTYNETTKELVLIL
nr:MAG TPA: hypothetical protein [Bacteriophage sp.]